MGYYFQANACILAFDVTRKVTYKNLETWYKELRHYCPDIPVIVVANKVDADIKLAIKSKEEPADEVMAEIWNLLRDDGEHKLEPETYDDEPKCVPAHWIP